MGTAWTAERKARYMHTMAEKRNGGGHNGTHANGAGVLESAKAAVKTRLLSSVDAMDTDAINKAVVDLQSLKDLEQQIKQIQTPAIPTVAQEPEPRWAANV